MEELHTDLDLHALEELMINQQWNEASFDGDSDGDELLSSIEIDAIYQLDIPNS